MSNEMKPVRCGCGGEVAVLVGADEFHRWKLGYRVKCWECGIQTQQKRTKAEAIKAWNQAMGAKDINVPGKNMTLSETIAAIWDVRHTDKKNDPEFVDDVLVNAGHFLNTMKSICGVLLDQADKLHSIAEVMNK